MASKSVSPAVTWTETDNTVYTEQVSTSNAGFCGDFEYGPVNYVTPVNNESRLVSLFGKPSNDPEIYTSFFSAKNFLEYSSSLYLVRAKKAGQQNASVSGNAVVDNIDDYEMNHQNGTNSVGEFCAKYPGTLGNSLKVSMCDASTWQRTLTGTISVSTASKTVTGTTTQFLTKVSVGDYITFTSGGTEYRRQVASIASDTSLTLTEVAGVTATGLTAKANWKFQSLFDSAPLDSNEAEAIGATGDGMHIVVVDEDGAFSGTAGQVLERFENVFKSSNSTRFDGTSGYYATALKNSEYIWWMDHPTATVGTGLGFGAPVAPGAYKNLSLPISVSLVGGSNGSANATDGELIAGFSLFSNDELYDIGLVFTGKVSAAVQKHVIQNVAEARMDCVAFVSCFDPDNGSVVVGDTETNVQKLLTWASNTLNVSSSYGVLDSGVGYFYDKYNDKYRWIPMNASVAGLCARTDYIAEPFFSPAGYSRGQIKSVIRLGVNPKKTVRDDLWKKNINPIVSFPGQGIVLFGDKTMQAKPSAFDAINVRRLFIILEKSIATAAKYFLFEQNDEITRQLFLNMVNPFLRDIKSRRGIDDFLVDVGPTVNTAQVLNAREFRGNIYVRPIGAIRNIALNFIATPYGVEFTEYTVA